MSSGSNGTECRDVLEGSSVAAVTLYVNDLARSRAFYETDLGLRLLEAGNEGVEYDTGPTTFRLCAASAHQIVLPERDTTADLTFLVDDLEAVRRALEANGVQLSDPLRYQIGATAGFHDPDGHKISLYEPSELALTWPSGDKIRAIRAASAPASATPHGGPLGGRELIYLFLFVPDADAAYAFYHEILGLRDLECRPCRRGSTTDPRGVVKYDAGGLMLTTHHVDVGEPADGAPKPEGPPRDLSPGAMKALAPVFHVADVARALDAMDAAGIRTEGPIVTSSGRRARFEDPFGRIYLLEEPSASASGHTADGAEHRPVLAARS